MSVQNISFFCIERYILALPLLCHFKSEKCDGIGTKVAKITMRYYIFNNANYVCAYFITSLSSLSL